MNPKGVQQIAGSYFSYYPLEKTGSISYIFNHKNKPSNFMNTYTALDLQHKVKVEKEGSNAKSIFVAGL